MDIKLTFPLDNIILTQLFGDNPTYYADPKFGGIIGHNGLDFLTWHGQPIYASHNGFATYQVDSSGGCGVVIQSEDGFKTIYWHMCDHDKEPEFKSPIKDNPKYVENGELIGYADNTGASTGDHLHFGLKLNTKKDGEWITVNKDNGYLGAIDPLPHFDKSFPFQINILKKEITILKQVVDLLKALKLKLLGY